MTIIMKVCVCVCVFTDGGTGLGLAISRQLTALHHGCIWVEDNILRKYDNDTHTMGCQFHFIWPFRRMIVPSSDTKVNHRRVQALREGHQDTEPSPQNPGISLKAFFANSKLEFLRNKRSDTSPPPQVVDALF